MKKILVATLLSSVLVTAYGQKAEDQLNYIPADTAYFIGQFKPININAYFQNFVFTSTEDLPTLAEDAEPSEKFLETLLVDYIKQISKKEVNFSAFYGLPETSQSFAFLIGASPVIKIQMDKPEVFFAYLDKVEKESGFTHTTKKSGDLEYRNYKSQDVNIIVGFNNGYTTIAAQIPGSSDDFLALALGQKQAKNPLSKSDRLSTLKKEYANNYNHLGYLSITEIAKAMTTNDGNRLAIQMAKAEFDKEKRLGIPATPACASEITSIAQNWPQIDFLSDIQVNSDHALVKGDFVIKSNNKVILDALQSLNGHIPSFIKDQSMLSLGIGANMDNLLTGALTIFNDLNTPKLQCEPLAQMQASITNPAGIGMFTGMAQGVQGLSLALYDLEMDDENINKIDALLALPAKDPMQIINTLKSFAPPELASIEIKQNGAPVDLSPFTQGLLPLGQNVKLNLAAKDQFVTLYSGETATKAVEKLNANKIDPNGLFAMYFDYSALAKSMKNLMPSDMLDEMGMESLEESNAKASIILSSQKDGIHFDSRMSTDKPK